MPFESATSTWWSLCSPASGRHGTQRVRSYVALVVHRRRRPRRRGYSQGFSLAGPRSCFAIRNGLPVRQVFNQCARPRAALRPHRIRRLERRRGRSSTRHIDNPPEPITVSGGIFCFGSELTTANAVPKPLLAGPVLGFGQCKFLWRLLHRGGERFEEPTTRRPSRYPHVPSLVNILRISGSPRMPSRRGSDVDQTNAPARWSEAAFRHSSASARCDSPK